MKKVVLLAVYIMCSVLVSAQDIQGFVSRQMATYPKSRLLDIYKSCFQDYMGAEHLVSNPERVKAYLDEKLNATTLDELMPWQYEPCGTDSNYYRVSIRTVKEGVITEDMLMNVICWRKRPRPSYISAIPEQARLPVAFHTHKPCSDISVSRPSCYFSNFH